MAGPQIWLGWRHLPAGRGSTTLRAGSKNFPICFPRKFAERYTQFNMGRFRRLTRWLLSLLATSYLGLVILVGCEQRSLLYHPSHSPIPTQTDASGLVPWRKDGRVIGFCHEVSNPKHIWLMLHGNAGQAQGRKYALATLPTNDSFYVVEYPGFGTREGSPTFDSMNAAAVEAYQTLSQRFPNQPISVLGESMGSGPASFLSHQSPRPERIALVVPYDRLVSVAAEKKPYLPVSLILQDRWDNIASLQGFQGRIDIYAATEDTIIPVAHARNLAKNVANAHLHEFTGEHNDWSHNHRVVLED